MRLSWPLILSLSLILVACAPQSNPRANTRNLRPNDTGYVSPDGNRYNHGGDQRVDTAMRNGDSEVNSTQPTKSNSPALSDLTENQDVTMEDAIYDYDYDADVEADIEAENEKEEAEVHEEQEPKASDEEDQPATDETVAPETPKKMAPPAKKPTGQLRLRDRLREFKISRYEGSTNKLSRYGSKRFVITMYFRDRSAVEFKGIFKGSKPNLHVDVSASGFTLKGRIVDHAEGKDQAKGEFILTEGKEKARLFYWAYRAINTPRIDADKPLDPNSDIAKQIEDMRKNTYSWVHNWTVLQDDCSFGGTIQNMKLCGPSFFVADVVCVNQSNICKPDSPGYAIKGESNYVDGEKMYAVQTNVPNATEAELIGVAVQGVGRSVIVKFEDPGSHDTHDVAVDIDLDDPVVNPPDYGPDPVQEEKPSETPEEKEEIPPTTGSGALHDDESGAPTNPPHPRPRPSHTPGDTDQLPEPGDIAPAGPITGNTFLNSDLSLPRTKLMFDHFKRNFNLESVQNWISIYSGQKKVKRNYPSELMRFYEAAKPFKGLFETIANGLDVLSSYAYIAVIESKFFVGRDHNVPYYPIEAAGSSTALGPFQILDGTAKNPLYMRVYNGNTTNSKDERRYFIPSACGGAMYIRQIVDDFKKTDATISILGYYQGPGAAKDYARRFGYTWAEMDRKQIATQEIRNYVNKKLAIHFISTNLSQYGLKEKLEGLSAEMPEAAKGKIRHPTMEINNKECRALF